jgi:hypothetical protein
MPLLRSGAPSRRPRVESISAHVDAGQIATAAGGGLRYRRLMDTAVIVPMGVILVMAVIVVAAWWVGQNRRG